jgi:CheY-like chemotaxis protein
LQNRRFLRHNVQSFGFTVKFIPRNQTMTNSSDNPRPPNVLVIEDELGMREILEMMLQRLGYRVDVASSGRKALEMLAAKGYDLLLCDIRLGDLTGLEVLKYAKTKDPGTVVIMISAYANTETAVEAMNLGAYDYVPKPFNMDELQETLRKALDLKTLNPEIPCPDPFVATWAPCSSWPGCFSATSSPASSWAPCYLPSRWTSTWAMARRALFFYSFRWAISSRWPARGLSAPGSPTAIPSPPRR